jgi:hypothetical protein
VPKLQALEFRVRATQLAWAGCPRAETRRLIDEFIADYEGDADPTVVARVAMVKRMYEHMKRSEGE